MHPAQGLVVLGVALDAVGIGVLAPVLDGPNEIGPRHGASVVDQNGLVAPEVLGGAAARQRGQHHGMAQRDVPGGKGLGRGGHGAQPAAEPHLAPSLTDGEAAAVRHPRPTRPGTVVGPHPPSVRRRSHPGYHGRQPGLLAMQVDDCLGQPGITDRVRVELEEPIYRGGQRSCHLIERLRIH